MPGPRRAWTTAPHLAQRDLVYVTPERLDEFFAAVVHGFHDDYVSAKWEPHRKVFEPERSFGFAVPEGDTPEPLLRAWAHGADGRTWSTLEQVA